MLAWHGFPDLSDRDEHAIDAVHSAFVTWASSRKARRLVDSISDDPAIRRKIDQAIRSGTDERLAELADELRHEVHDLIHDHVHAQVHHEVTHAVHDSGHVGGGHGGGGHGGH
jgi:hypothetical protein